LLTLDNPYEDNICGSEQLFNSTPEECVPCAPSTNQVRWVDIIDKPSCYPSCDPSITGVITLNSLTGNLNLVTGSSGNDFSIVTSGSNITFNLPTSSSTKRGLLSSTDWSIFNNKFNTPTGTTLQYLRGDGSLATFPTSFAPSGVASGDLTGNYPGPSIATNAVTVNKIANGAVTNDKILSVSWSKLTSTPTTLSGYGITDALPITGGTLTGRVYYPFSPLSGTEIVNKDYVDSIAAGFNYVTPVEVATTADLNSTYNNGAFGIGATLTCNVNGAISIDTVVLSVNDRIVVKDQTNLFENGIYEVTNTGSAGTPFILTRTTDSDAPSELLNLTAFILNGTVNIGKTYSQREIIVTVGTTDVIFTLISISSTYTAGTGIDISGTIISILNAPVSVGGTGQTSFTSGQILFGDGASPIATDPGLYWDNSNKRIGINESSPLYPIHTYKGAGTNAIFIESDANQLAALFLGDTNTSIYRPVSTQDIRILTNSSDRAIFNSSGDFGLGTNSPTNHSGYTTFAINNNTDGGIIDFMNSGTIVGQISNSASLFSIGTVNSSPLNFNTSNSTRLTIDSSGNLVFNDAGSSVDFRIEGDTNQNLFFVDGSADSIGIGTSTPAQYLHVFNSSVKNILLENSASGSVTAGYLYKDADKEAKFGSFAFSLGMGSTTADTFSLFYNNSAIVNINGTNVGFNQASPTVPLHLLAPGTSGGNLSIVRLEEQTANNYIDIVKLDNSTQTDFNVNSTSIFNITENELELERGFKTSAISSVQVGSYSVLITDYIVQHQNNGTAPTITLPAISTVGVGKRYIILMDSIGTYSTIVAPTGLNLLKLGSSSTVASVSYSLTSTASCMIEAVAITSNIWRIMRFQNS